MAAKYMPHRLHPQDISYAVFSIKPNAIGARLPRPPKIIPAGSVCTPYNPFMTIVPWTIRGLRHALATGASRPTVLADQALAQSNRNPGRNTYLWQDALWTRSEAARVEAMPRAAGGPFGDGRSALWGLPVSVKDCFDLAGAPTSCGVHFYRELNGNAARDSWLVAQLRASGAVITGKTHLHPLAYGITGENPEFGDCLQPGNPNALTGGSSSGAVASVLEGSAVAAIGTDTGGSVRVPAALCGLAGYRSTIGRGDWRGGAHLAESFDTMGWLFRDLEDAPLLAAPFAPAEAASISPRHSRPHPMRRCERELSPRLRTWRLSPVSAPLSVSWKHSASNSVPSIPAGGPSRLKSLRPFRHGKPRACTPATSTASSPPSASGWNGARASLQMKLPRCVTSRRFQRAHERVVRRASTAPAALRPGCAPRRRSGS